MSPQFKARRARPPLNEATLREIALRYVSRYATTRAKLRAYLDRKLRERGWQGDDGPDLEALANRFAELQLIDDSAFALSQARTFASRGYGRQRLAAHLRSAGVADEDGLEALEAAESDAVAAALRFAQRRKIGPFATQTPDRQAREKALAAMLRAGHNFGLARAIVRMDAGAPIDLINLCATNRIDAA